MKLNAFKKKCKAGKIQWLEKQLLLDQTEKRKSVKMSFVIQIINRNKY